MRKVIPRGWVLRRKDNKTSSVYLLRTIVEKPVVMNAGAFRTPFKNTGGQMPDARPHRHTLSVFQLPYFPYSLHPEFIRVIVCSYHGQICGERPQETEEKS